MTESEFRRPRRRQNRNSVIPEEDRIGIPSSRKKTESEFRRPENDGIGIPSSRKMTESEFRRPDLLN